MIAINSQSSLERAKTTKNQPHYNLPKFLKPLDLADMPPTGHELSVVLNLSLEYRHTIALPASLIVYKKTNNYLRHPDGSGPSATESTLPHPAHARRSLPSAYLIRSHGAGIHPLLDRQYEI